MESGNHSLKVEAIHGERFATREVAIAHVFEYIEVDLPSNPAPLDSGLPQPGAV